MAKTTETPRNREGDAPAGGQHWTSPGLPPPPINHVDKSASPGGPADRRDAKTDGYMKEAKVRNTQAGD